MCSIRTEQEKDIKIDDVLPSVNVSTVTDGCTEKSCVPVREVHTDKQSLALQLYICGCVILSVWSDFDFV